MFSDRPAHCAWAGVISGSAGARARFGRIAPRQRSGRAPTAPEEIVIDTTAQPGFYDRAYAEQIANGHDTAAAIATVAERYLDGWPATRGKNRITQGQRDAAFWLGDCLRGLSADHWRQPPLQQALTRYFAQEKIANPALLHEVAAAAPEVIRDAVRHSGLVLMQQSPRRAELDALDDAGGVLAELRRVLDVFDRAWRQRVAATEAAQALLAGQSALVLLVLASLHAFEHWVEGAVQDDNDGPDSIRFYWDAVNDVLVRALRQTAPAALKLTEQDLALTLAEHLSPLLFASKDRPARDELRAPFARLITLQMELNSFVSQSADAFSYDDAIRHVLRDGKPQIDEIDPQARADRKRDAARLAQLHGYWRARAEAEFAASPLAGQTLGTPETHDDNRRAHVNALCGWRRLVEVHGLDERVMLASGERVDLFQALLALELMTAYYLQQFIIPFMAERAFGQDWITALRQLAVDGIANGMQGRFPLTWSDRDDKIANITGWTVTPEQPQGSPKMAAAILDCWTSDWPELATRLQAGEPGLEPELFERPVIKLGRLLVQLPWVTAFQNHSTAAINNLRRLGARRSDARAETARIDARLGEKFAARGFTVLPNWTPPADRDAGEIDLICARDGIVFVLEVKSTFPRRSQREAFTHATVTLGRAGRQLRRKVAAVRSALDGDGLPAGFGGAAAQVVGWIVDTSIEADHRRFDGFLKLSLEELLIALGDDRHWLWPADTAPAALPSLYARGFHAQGLIDVIDSGAVWREPASA